MSHLAKLRSSWRSARRDQSRRVEVHGEEESHDHADHEADEDQDDQEAEEAEDLANDPHVSPSISGTVCVYVHLIISQCASTVTGRCC